MPARRLGGHPETQENNNVAALRQRPRTNTSTIYMGGRSMKAKAVETLLLMEPSKENPRNSEGAMIELKDGRLSLGYSRFTGGGADNSAAQIALRIADHDGRGWSGDKLLIGQEGVENVMSLSLLRLQSGEILVLYLIKNGWDDCRPYVRVSSDEMETAGEKRLAVADKGYFVVNNDRLVQLASGRLIIPAALHNCTDGTVKTWDHRGVAMCYVSDDNGRTWRRSKGVLEAPAESRSGLQEPGVVERRDGRLMMWMRTDMRCQYQSFSRDGGETWSRAEPSPMMSPVSPATIKRMPWTGDLLLVWNDHSGKHVFPPGRRTPLCTAYSTDDGRTWKNSKILEGYPDGWYCYISMTFVDEHAVLSYCAGDSKVGGLNRLKAVAVHKDWIYA